jgi:hypothetical protein
MKKKLPILFFIILLSLQFKNAFAQPGNDDCFSAETLTSDVNCNPTTGSSLGATQSITGSCFGTDDDDVWYQFTAVETTHTITVTGYNGFDAVINVLSGSCDGSSLSCTDATGPDQTETAVVSGLTIGDTYLIRVYHFDVGDGGGDFDICVTHDLPPAPENDECSGAIILTSDVNCSSTSGSSLGGTSSGISSCLGNSDDDVWYQFTATATSHTVTVTGSGGFDAVIDVRSGACDGTNISCTDNSGPDQTETAVVTGLTIGDDYLIRVYHYGAGDAGGAFDICVTNDAPPAAPANDDCSGAIVLTSDVSCNSTSGSSLGGTSSGIGSCTGNDDDDVWYQFTATATTHTVTVTGSGGFDAVIDVRSGPCDGTNLSCTDSTGPDQTETAVVSGLTIGDDYFVRVYHYGVGDAGGAFDICVTNDATPPTPANDECVDAIVLTSSTTCNPTTGTSAGATNSISGSCSGNDDDDVWYQFTAVATTHTVTVNGSGGFDAVVDVRSGSCTGTSLSCTDASGIDGTEAAVVSGLTIGDDYLIRVYHYGAGDGGGAFDICVTHETAAPPANDECTDAISLTSTTTCNPTTGTSLGATNSITGTCPGNDDDDVWYSFVAVATTHNVIVQGSGGFDAVIDVRSGACTGTNLSCTDDTGPDGLETAIASGLTIGDTYFVRVYHYGVGDGGGDFTICVTHAAPNLPANDECSGAISITSALTCNYTTGSSLGGTQSFAGTCAGNDDDDVWYKFTAMDTMHTISVQGYNGFDPVIDMRYGACTGTNFDCKDDTGPDGLETSVVTGLTVGTDYYIRVYHYGAGDGGGDFGICVTHTTSNSCTYAISPNNHSFTSAAGTGTISVTSGSGCNWTAVSNNSWITITSGSTGTANGTVNYSVTANTGNSQRTGTITVGGQTFTVAQSGTTACTYAISPTSHSFTSAAGTATINVTSGNGCHWTATTNSNWITITSGSSGTANGTVNYSVTANTSTSTRTGTITIGGQVYNVTQSGTTACTYTIAPTNHTFTSAAGTATINVTTANGCNWTAATNDSWITITSGSSGSGNGTVNYSVTANTNSSQRTGTITIGGQNYTVTQSGTTNCTYTIAPTSQTYPSPTATGTVTVTTANGCNWTANSTDNWITITSGSTGSGNGTVHYSITANSSSSSRTGTITIGGQTFTITQSGNNGCTYTIAPTSQTYPAAAATGTVTVTTANGCNWTASTTDSWISITSGSTGSGNGTVNYSITANTGTSSRTGTITIGGQTFTITQSGTTSCTYTIAPTSQTFTAAAGTGTITVTAATGCTWTASTTDTWITITSGSTGSGNGTVNFSVTANTGASRTGTITIGGQTFTVTQSGITCTYTLTPTTQTFTSPLDSGTVTVASPAGCTWTSSSNNSWITITYGVSGSGNGTVKFSITTNTNTASRTGTITIGGQTFTITQNGIVCPPVPTIQVGACDLAANTIPNVTYQWYFANSPIGGATSQFYTITQVGFYSVYVTDITNNCVTPSQPTFVTCSLAGIDEADISNAVSIFPNPSSGHFNITSGKVFTSEKVSIDIYNIFGEEIYSSFVYPINGAITLSIDNISPAKGIYSVLLKSGKTKILKRIVFN